MTDRKAGRGNPAAAVPRGWKASGLPDDAGIWRPIPGGAAQVFITRRAIGGGAARVVWIASWTLWGSVGARAKDGAIGDAYSSREAAVSAANAWIRARLKGGKVVKNPGARKRKAIIGKGTHGGPRRYSPPAPFHVIAPDGTHEFSTVTRARAQSIVARADRDPWRVATKGRRRVKLAGPRGPLPNPGGGVPAGARWIRVGGHRVHGVKRSDGTIAVYGIEHPKRERGACSLKGAMKGHATFTGRDAERVEHAHGPASVPDVVYRLGALEALQYRSDKWDGKARSYVHKFGRQKPRLCADAAGRLWIVGGGYSVKAAGIVG